MLLLSIDPGEMDFLPAQLVPLYLWSRQVHLEKSSLEPLRSGGQGHAHIYYIIYYICYENDCIFLRAKWV